MRSWAIMGEYEVAFYYGSFEGELKYLAQDLVKLDLSSQAFKGDGSLALFEKGTLVDYIHSVISEGNGSVWKLINGK